jgi:uncharacterized membrane protein HdeD (DUF308 family)
VWITFQSASKYIHQQRVDGLTHLQGERSIMTKAAAKTQAPQAPAQPQRPWWLTLIGGVLAIVVGAILLWGNLVTQVKTYFLLVEVLGVWWLVDGIFDIVHMFTDHTQWAWKLFIGVVSIIAGGYILMYPVLVGLELPALFVLILGIWGVIKGALMIVMAFKGGGGAYAILGIFAVFFGIVLIAAYTVPGVGYVAVWFAAIFGIVGGGFLIYRAFQQRRA